MPPRKHMPKMQTVVGAPLVDGPMVYSPARAYVSGLKATALSAAVVALLAVAGLAASQAQAAGLGRLSVHSALGQALVADVEVPAVSADEAPSLQVRLASPAAFKQADLEFNQALTQLRFDLQKTDDGRYFVRITSAQEITEPYLDLLLELTWSGGRVQREYTVLLDPPGMRQAPEIVAPVTSPVPEAVQPAPAPLAPTTAPVAPAPMPGATEVAPAPAAAAPQPPPAVPSPPAPAVANAPASVHVRTGDTLGKIALANKSQDVSLDQMLVALLHANPTAFIGGNMNRVLAGADLAVPASSAVQAIDSTEAHRVVVAQSSDFAAYRSRLARAAAAAPPVQEQQAVAAGQGKVTPKVEDKSAAQKAGDQLKIARAEEAKNAAARKDEEVARQRAIQEQKDRAAALEKTNADIRRASELAAKAAAEKAAADKAAADKAAAEKAAADKAAAEKAAADKLAAAKAAADKAAADKAAADKAAADQAAAEKAAKTGPAVTAPAPAQKPAAPAPAESWTDTLLSLPVLAVLGVALLGVLVVLNFLRRRGGAADQVKAEDPMAANSLFGAAGGQSVDTGATSTFNSSFIPAASQLDSNEVDPVAEADVYVAYGREEQAEEILKEALRLQPDRAAVRVKLLEIYSRRGDTASFNAVAKELHERSGGTGEDWDRAAKLGKSLDPTNPLYAGATSLPDTFQPVTPDMHAGSGHEAPTIPAASTTTIAGELESDTLSHMVGDKSRLLGASSEGQGPETAMPPETGMPADAAAAAALGRPTGGRSFEATLPAESPPSRATTSSAPPPSIDFGALDFDLGPSKINFESSTEMPTDKDEGVSTTPAPLTRPLDAPTIPSLDLMFASNPPTKPGASPPTLTGSVPIPNIDLNLPAATPQRAESPAVGSLEEALSRPTLVGAVGALGGDGDGLRLSSNTDQATVPLIDFDLTGADAAMTGRRTETQAGSPMASQMATKLDLARGYIDLGVKDGARELLEEVMKDGTREQRQQAVELIKLVEA